jgi:hypothetical protein
MADDADRLMSSWLANKNFEHLEKYVHAGRKFRDLDIGEVKRQWVIAFKILGANFRNDPPERADLEAELQIRGQEPPHDLVKPELEALKKAAAEAFKQIQAEGRTEEVGADIERDLEEYRRRAEKGN